MSRPISSESVYGAISHPIRRRILDLLRQGERNAGDISDTLRVSPPVLSAHLHVLRATGLVRNETDGRRHIYYLEAKPLREVARWARGFDSPRGE